MKEIAKALEKNKTLLYLNLSNNQLEEIIGNQFIESTFVNWDLISLEIGFNDLLLIQIQEIWKNIMRNKAIYDEWWLKEWRERKWMAEEEALMRVFVLEE